MRLRYERNSIPGLVLTATLLLIMVPITRAGAQDTEPPDLTVEMTLA